MRDETIVIFTSDNGGDIGQIEEQQARELGFKNNGDLRGDKHTIWEGGFKVPFVVRWPDVVREGSQSDSMVNIVDIFATLQEVVGGAVLDSHIAGADSFSLCPILRGGPTEESGRTMMVLNDASGVVAIRTNGWKYIEDKVLKPARNGMPPRKPRPQLFNLEQDPVEENNLIAAFPEIAEDMQATLDRIRLQGSERTVAGEER